MSATLTQIGTSLGTPAYMAPEQAAGDPETDHRADIYAFGAMAYELLAGRTPFHGLPPHKMLAAHMSETPATIASLRPDTPPALAGVIAVGAFIVLVGGWMLLRALGIGPDGSLMASGAMSQRERVVMADFSGNAPDSLLAPTITEAFRTALAESPNLNIMAAVAVRDVLRRMQRPADTTVSSALARARSPRAKGSRRSSTGTSRSSAGATSSPRASSRRRPVRRSRRSAKRPTMKGRSSRRSVACRGSCARAWASRSRESSRRSHSTGSRPRRSPHFGSTSPPIARCNSTATSPRASACSGRPSLGELYEGEG
jgi:serine/threonine protein kinase